MDNNWREEGGNTLLYYIQGSNEKRKTENGNLRVSESRSKIYFDYAEQQGGKDREAGLKRKTSKPPPSLRTSSPLSQGDKEKRGADERGAVEQ